MSKSRSGTEIVLALLAIVLGLYILYYIVIFLIKLFVFTGYNSIFFLDNLFAITPFNPVVTWGIFGVILGSIVGVTIAVKKYKLSKLLILYPGGFLLLVILIMYFVNAPFEYSGTYLSPADISRQNELINNIASKNYYTVYSDAKVREGPSNSKAQLFTIKRGDEVEVIAKGFFDRNNTEWFQIRFNGREGYASARLLRFSRVER